MAARYVEVPGAGAVLGSRPQVVRPHLLAGPLSGRGSRSDAERGDQLLLFPRQLPVRHRIADVAEEHAFTLSGVDALAEDLHVGDEGEPRVLSPVGQAGRELSEDVAPVGRLVLAVQPLRPAASVLGGVGFVVLAAEVAGFSGQADGEGLGL